MKQQYACSGIVRNSNHFKTIEAVSELQAIYLFRRFYKFKVRNCEAQPLRPSQEQIKFNI